MGIDTATSEFGNDLCAITVLKYEEGCFTLLELRQRTKEEIEKMKCVLIEKYNIASENIFTEDGWFWKKNTNEKFYDRLKRKMKC